MSVQMIGRELDDIVRELYVLPPAEFVTARNELVRQARAAGSREVAERLRQLRRPTRSAWLVNLLASDSRAMQRLSALGRELRDAQTGLVRTELRNLAEQRRQLIADLLDRTKAHAA
jgi:MoxR-like ATPase